MPKNNKLNIRRFSRPVEVNKHFPWNLKRIFYRVPLLLLYFAISTFLFYDDDTDHEKNTLLDQWHNSFCFIAKTTENANIIISPMKPMPKNNIWSRSLLGIYVVFHSRAVHIQPKSKFETVSFVKLKQLQKSLLYKKSKYPYQRISRIKRSSSQLKNWT